MPAEDREMIALDPNAAQFGTGTTIPLCRPRIEPERDGWGWLVLLPSGHAWLAGDRRAALTEFAELERIERGSPS
jgi:hypothetical protein